MAKEERNCKVFLEYWRIRSVARTFQIEFFHEEQKKVEDRSCLWYGLNINSFLSCLSYSSPLHRRMHHEREHFFRFPRQPFTYNGRFG
jgi:hypothetical protein